MRVPLGSLQLHESPRLSPEDPRHVRLLVETGDAVPPILVCRGTMRVVDGRHRVRAAQQRGDTTIEARFFDGTDDEAFVAALVANRTHGLPLTLADREAAAARLLGREPQRSDRAVAEITGLSPHTVGRIRRAAPDAAGARARVGRDGRVRPLDGADGRRVASEVIARRPGSSLREIARMAGISPTTARDVRERLRRGDDPVPRRLRGAMTDPGPRPTGRHHDWESMLHNLNRDPSLRFTDSGRALLRWLFTHARDPDGWEQVVDEIPPHCVYIVAEVARDRADSWSAFAGQLQQRLRASA